MLALIKASPDDDEPVCKSAVRALCNMNHERAVATLVGLPLGRIRCDERIAFWTCPAADASVLRSAQQVGPGLPLPGPRRIRPSFFQTVSGIMGNIGVVAGGHCLS